MPTACPQQKRANGNGSATDALLSGARRKREEKRARMARTTVLAAARATQYCVGAGRAAQAKPGSQSPVPLGLAGWLALLKHGVIVSFRVAPAALLLGPGQLAGAVL